MPFPVFISPEKIKLVKKERFPPKTELNYESHILKGSRCVTSLPTPAMRVSE